MSANLHISISAEPVFHVGGLVITNSILTSLIVTALIVGFAFSVNRSLAKVSTQKIAPLQNIAESLVEWLYDLIQSVTNNHKKTRLFLPLIISYFAFILCNNWFGLLPGVGTVGFTETVDGHQEATLLKQDFAIPVDPVYASEIETTSLANAAESHTVATETKAVESGATVAPVAHEAVVEKAAESHTKFVPYLRAGTADLNTTAALAIITVIAAQAWGFKYLHFGYLKKFFNFANPIMFFVGILELISEFSKVMSYAFRLFGNIFAGEVLLAVMGALAPLVVPMVFYGLEIFVGGIQALVFSLLSIIFYQVATLGHDEE
jgi:F-type H+-transporting ATPase subunit a